MPKLPAIYVVSDIHLDTGPFEWPEAALSADLILVAGDLANGVFDIEFLKKPNKPLVFVAGNHDFWSKGATRDMTDIHAGMKRAAEGSLVHVLWDEELELEGIRIIGTPLWTDFGGGNEELMAASFVHSRDYAYTNAKSWYENPENLKLHQEQGQRFTRFDQPDPSITGAFTPLVAYSLHQKSRAYIESRLEKDFDGLTILVTHMAPSYDCLRKSGVVSEHYLDMRNWVCRGLDNTTLARVGSYASDLSEMFDRYRNRLDLAVHGHIHASLDIVCGSSRVVSNPRGRYSGPLTDDCASRYSLLGVSISEQDIKKSQATFALDPNRGDNGNFDGQKLVRLEDGLAPAIRPSVDEALPRLLELRSEMLELQPFVSHKKLALRRCVHESAVARAEEFASIITGVLQPALDAFDVSGRGGGDWYATLRCLGLPEPSHALYPRFSSLFDRKIDPSVAIAGSIEAMAHLLWALPQVPDVAELGRKKYALRVTEAMHLIAARGFIPALTDTPPAAHWRKLYFDLGSVRLDVSEEVRDELSDIVDKLINHGAIPRQAYLAVRAPYRPRASRTRILKAHVSTTPP